jgi:hypothetical protein
VVGLEFRPIGSVADSAAAALLAEEVLLKLQRHDAVAMSTDTHRELSVLGSNDVDEETKCGVVGDILASQAVLPFFACISILCYGYLL